MDCNTVDQQFPSQATPLAVQAKVQGLPKWADILVVETELLIVVSLLSQWI